MNVLSWFERREKVKISDDFVKVIVWLWMHARCNTIQSSHSHQFAIQCEACISFPHFFRIYYHHQLTYRLVDFDFDSTNCYTVHCFATLSQFGAVLSTPHFVVRNSFFWIQTAFHLVTVIFLFIKFLIFLFFFSKILRYEIKNKMLQLVMNNTNSINEHDH